MNYSGFVLRPISVANADELRNQGGVIYAADTHPGYPCRQCLRDAEVGDELLLVSHDPFAKESPYRSASPIFIHREPCTPPDLDQLPVQLVSRQLSLRSFNSQEMMLAGRVVDGAELSEAIRSLFEEPTCSTIHVHNAGRGCWAVAVERQ